MSKLGILGGGIGGSCLARALKHHGYTSNHKYTVRLIEQEPFRVNTFGGGITLTPNAIRGLDSLGLYSKIRKYSVPLNNIYTYNEKGMLSVWMWYANQLQSRQATQKAQLWIRRKSLWISYSSYGSVFSFSSSSNVLELI